MSLSHFLTSHFLTSSLSHFLNLSHFLTFLTSHFLTFSLSQPGFALRSCRNLPTTTTVSDPPRRWGDYVLGVSLASQGRRSCKSVCECCGDHATFSRSHFSHFLTFSLSHFLNFSHFLTFLICSLSQPGFALRGCRYRPSGINTGCHPPPLCTVLEVRKGIGVTAAGGDSQY